MEGFIFIYRELRNHWIWEHPEKLKWWLDILLTVNFIDNEKVNIGYQLFECKRGQSLLSLSSWADRWNVNKDTARNFIKLLEKDKMITLENLGKTTRLTVCNYDKYQNGLHANQTQTKRKPNANQTQSHPIEEREEGKERKERKEEIATWRNSFEIYLQLVEEAKQSIFNDTELLKKRQDYDPKLDIKKSIQRSIDDYWGQTAGWINKKKSRGLEINMKATLLKNYDKNKVWLSGTPEENNKLIEKGFLFDALTAKGIEFDPQDAYENPEKYQHLCK